MFSSSRTPIEDQVIADHEELKSYYQNFKTSGDMKWYNQFVFDICRHTVGEEVILYPLLDNLGIEGHNFAEEGRNKHHCVKEALTRMERLTSGPREAFEREWEVLMQDLTQHMEQEERDDLRLIRERVGYEDRISYGDQFQNRKSIAATRPHPSTSDKPVLLEEAMSLLAAPVDRFRDLFRSFPSKEAQKQQFTEVPKHTAKTMP